MQRKKILHLFALLCASTLLTSCASQASTSVDTAVATTSTESNQEQKSSSSSSELKSSRAKKEEMESETDSALSSDTSIIITGKIDSPKQRIENSSEETNTEGEPVTETVSEEVSTETDANTEIASEEASTEVDPYAELTMEQIADLAKNLPSSDTYDYVALGNSVTTNVTDDLWHGSWGMAATSQQSDYVHIVGTWLTGQTSQPVNVQALTIEEWEVAPDRNVFYVQSSNTENVTSDEASDSTTETVSTDETVSTAEGSSETAAVSTPVITKTEISEMTMMEQIDTYVNENTDLITIQTGENITDNKADLVGDYTKLVSYIKEKAPNAKIFMLAELLWPSGDIEGAKQAVCGQNGIFWVDMSEYLNGYDTLYRSALGTLYVGDDGNTYSIANEVVAAHPSDAGMANIAQQVINQLSVH